MIRRPIQLPAAERLHSFHVDADKERLNFGVEPWNAKQSSGQSSRRHQAVQMTTIQFQLLVPAKCEKYSTLVSFRKYFASKV
jgi:hypothetical protein